eukprot:CAMPEP_0175102338 /NCGR_PEP_ID=MMETSP0086_2-20121207/8377_1 /TAXON_ID=136419 /ORGANISM="Unknown Unknown, Strain D1" /LENGTH=69 /DNA_ID=CAMNT_0016377129 /DNA_START=137 /DNA_END=346 /DNA_ORIENTATION=-
MIQNSTEQTKHFASVVGGGKAKINGHENGWMDGWMDGMDWMDGWMDGWDGWDGWDGMDWMDGLDENRKS